MNESSLQEIVCLFGQPVAGNPTQYIIEKALAAAGLDWRYLTLEVSPDNLADAIRGMRAMGFRGGNITAPHKINVIPLLDDLSEAARLMGAVNCVYRDDGKLVGENTDGKGFVQSLRGVTDPVGKRLLILGAGGAARAIAVEMALAAVADITIVNRDVARGQELVDLLNDKVHVPARFLPWEGDFELPEEMGVVINATTIGMHSRAARVPLNIATLNEGTVVADVIINPPDTRFLAEAKVRGCLTLDGLGMLVNQAVIGFKIWTGQDPDPTLMREALEEFLGV